MPPWGYVYYSAASAGLLPRDPPLLMKRLLPAPRAVFLQLYLPLHFLLILVRIIIAPLADGAAERDQLVGSFHFRHGDNGSGFPQNGQVAPFEPMAGFEPATYSLPWSCSTS